MKIMERKIKNWKDYVNPRNLALLRACNIQYKHALSYYKKQKWKEARKEYQNFIKMNLIDYDAFYQLGTCCFELGKMEIGNLKKQKHKMSPSKAKEIREYFDDCIKNLKKAGELEPKNLLLKEELEDKKKVIKKLKKKHRGAV